MMEKKTQALVRRAPAVIMASVEKHILIIHGQKVMLDTLNSIRSQPNA